MTKTTKLDNEWRCTYVLCITQIINFEGELIMCMPTLLTLFSYGNQ
jgi:hypothetical protein